jgi:hypothetical protein
MKPEKDENLYFPEQQFVGRAKLFVFTHNAMKMCSWAEMKPQALSVSALDGVEWSASSSGPLYPLWKKPHFPLDRRLDESYNRSGDGDEHKNTNSNRNSNIGRPASSQSRLLLRYSPFMDEGTKNL